MIKKLLFTIFFLLFFTAGFGRGSLLDMVISVDIKSTPVKVILETIETRAKVSFTYNPRIIDDQKVVSLTIRDKTIRHGLSLIFDQTIRFKEAGNHIILLKNEDKAVAKARRKADIEYRFAGTIVDIRSGKPIEYASIYEVDERYAAISDENGKYTLTVPSTHLVRSLYFKKKGYEPEVVVVSGDENQNVIINVSLIPIPEDVEPVNLSEVKQLENKLEDRAISGVLVSDATFIHGQNLKEIDEARWAQISLVPSVSIGSNLSTNALINNHFSLNVLAGYSKGVRGAEIGLLVNIIKEDVVGAQIGGVFNLVGNNTIGGQVSGVSNMVKGDVTGAQISGISGLTYGNITGAQISGICSIMKQDLTGWQLSGITSVIRGGFTGAQISGISNITYKKSGGAQIAGIFNVVRDSLFGGQIAGIANASKGGTNFLQISGISNFAHKNYGLQMAGIQNFSRENNGLQIGLINSSIRSKGIAIGLFNFVKEGYHKTEIAANEIFPVNLTFKTGTQRLYNTYNFGARFGPDRAYAAGLGFGSYFNLAEKLRLSLDLSGQLVFENDFEIFEFSQLFKVSTTIDYQLAKWVTVFAGPSLNLNLIQFKNDEGVYSTDVSFLPISDHTFEWGRSIYWIGGQVGFRF